MGNTWLKVFFIIGDYDFFIEYTQIILEENAQLIFGF